MFDCHVNASSWNLVSLLPNTPSWILFPTKCLTKKKLRTVFDLIDRDGNGIDVDEIASALNKLDGLSAVESAVPWAKKALDYFETDHLKMNMFEEFLIMLSNLMSWNL